MSTRGAIARKTADGFTGVYHHWDSYPAGLGATLYELRNGLFASDTDAMLRVLLDEHPAGWSTINGKDLTIAPRFIEFDDELMCQYCGQTSLAHLCQTSGPKTPLHRAKYPCADGTYALHVGHKYEPDPAEKAAQDAIPQCYCHGSRSEPGSTLDQSTAAGSGVEYAYVLDGSTMCVLSSYSDDGSKMIGMFGMGDPGASWHTLAVVELDKPAPDWAHLDEPVPVPQIIGTFDAMAADDFTAWRNANMPGGE